MTFALSGVVTGTAQTGLTAPTYTVVADTPPANNAKQVVVTALGGTQTGVAVHSVSSPFTMAMFRPLNFKFLQPVNAVTGVLKAVPTNVYKLITRKGVLPLAGQALKPLIITTTVEVPAGSDLADPSSVRAAMSLHIGGLSAQSAGIGDVFVSGTL